MLSPLIALINDQFQRLEALCTSMDIPITAWHGEANQAQKKRLLREPAGIVLMTPESLEAMLDAHPERVESLFSSLDWILVDEVHHFLASTRGVQLRSLLTRLQFRTDRTPRYIGMSATIVPENYTDVKSFFPPPHETLLVVDQQKAEIVADVSLHLDGEGEKSADQQLTDALFAELQKENLLIFPHSRRRVEEIAQGLQERVRRADLPIRIFAHHSSVEKAWRKEAEDWVKSGASRFALCATSTLELGIDIGAVDAVCQVEAPMAAHSLAQRLGRSGRDEVLDPLTGRRLPAPSRLHFHATSDLSFLAGLSALALVRSGELEPQVPIRKPYDVFAHQILATVLENNGVPVQALALLRSWPVFSFLTEDEVDRIVDYLIDQEYLELLEGEPAEVFLGLAGERVATGRDFYALFLTSTAYAVVAGKEQIGTLPLAPEVVVGAHILLSARVWEIQMIDDRSRRIFVRPASKGRAPTFAGAGEDRSAVLSHAMLHFLHHPPAEWTEKEMVAEALARLRILFPSEAPVQPLVSTESEWTLSLFCGTAGERTIFLLLRALLDKEHPSIHWDVRQSRLYGEDLRAAWRLLQFSYCQHCDIILGKIEAYLAQEPSLVARLLSGVKFRDLLPEDIRRRYICANLLVQTLEPILGEHD